MQATHSPIRWLVEDLYLAQARRLVTHLSRKVGLEHLEIAEDAVQEAFGRALERWANGVPDDPTAWLYRVSYRAVIDRLRKERLMIDAEMPERMSELGESEAAPDAELEAMFACCHPVLAPESRVALTLRTLVGWSVTRLAETFFCPYDTMEKRLTRARDRIRSSYTATLTEADRQERFPAVLHCLYLIYTEGYSAPEHPEGMQPGLCLEAMRMAAQLRADPRWTENTRLAALQALMCFQTSRFPARVGDAVQNLRLQDRRRWDRELIAAGFVHLAASGKGYEISPYHLEAAIASVHARSTSVETTDWRLIADLYTRLLALAPGPSVRLGRTVALLYADGPEAAERELGSLKGQISEHLLAPIRGELEARKTS